jgi:predicted nucleic acid-binding Zn ribbon protein
VPSDGFERARRALAEARADAAAKGLRPTAPQDAEHTGDQVTAPDSERLRGGAGQRGGPGPHSASRRRREDPQPLGTAIDGLLADQGWRRRAAVGAAFGRWAQIVGADLAAHARPESFSDGELVVVADSTAWATQLRLLAAQLVRRLNGELGDGTVRRVRVHGPSGESWSHRGGWRVRDERGPRDTYG